jgi:transposase
MYIFARNSQVIDKLLTQEAARILKLEAQLASQSQQIKELLAKITSLEQELSFYRTKKNSQNSSIPPSQDPYRVKRTESLREKSGRNPGGQPGHEGSCIEMSMEPTEIQIHEPSYCNCCGKDLSAFPSEFIGKHQVIDIPPVKPVVIEHQLYGKRCSCGHLTKSHYPVEAHSTVCYGSNIQALTAYFHARQYIPFERMRELYHDIFGLSISSGSLVNMIQSFADKSKGIYETIRERIAQSLVVGADETGTCINGKNAWTWGFQTLTDTFLYSIKSRAKTVIDQLFPQGFPHAVLVHDCWTAYFGVNVKGHQICTAHLLRELKYLDKLYTQQWTQAFTDLLHRALELKKNLSAEDYLKPIPERTKLEEQLDILLNQDIDPKHEKLITFKNRIIRYRNHLFSFLYQLEIPPDNYASERAIRTYKVKQKVSGLFRSDDGAKNFAIIRSVIDTTIKNTKNVWEALTLIPSMTGTE